MNMRFTGRIILSAILVLAAMGALAAPLAANAYTPCPYSAKDCALIAQAARGEITELASSPAAQQAQNLAMACAASHPPFYNCTYPNYPP